MRDFHFIFGHMNWFRFRFVWCFAESGKGLASGYIWCYIPLSVAVTSAATVVYFSYFSLSFLLLWFFLLLFTISVDCHHYHIHLPNLYASYANAMLVTTYFSFESIERIQMAVCARICFVVVVFFFITAVFIYIDNKEIMHCNQFGCRCLLCVLSRAQSVHYLKRYWDFITRRYIWQL